MAEFLLWWFLLWIGVNFLIGYALGKPKDQAISSALVCLLLGPIGWIICAVSSGKTRKCPYCAERVKASATVCRYCHRDLGAPDEEAFSATLIMAWAGGLTAFICALVFLWLAFRYSWQVREPDRQIAVSPPATPQKVATPASTVAPSSDFITLVKPAIINTRNGVTTVPAGTSARIVSRHGNNVWIHYGDADYEIPVDATDLTK
jgi:hypothetical protein